MTIVEVGKKIERADFVVILCSHLETHSLGPKSEINSRLTSRPLWSKSAASPPEVRPSHPKSGKDRHPALYRPQTPQAPQPKSDDKARPGPSPPNGSSSKAESAPSPPDRTTDPMQNLPHKP